MPDSSSGVTSLANSNRMNDLLSATQNAVVAVNSLTNTVTTKFSSIQSPTLPGGSSGQVQFNNSGSFGGFTVGGDATLVASAGTLTISAHAVTYAKIQTEGSSTLLGNLTNAAASPAEWASSQVVTFTNGSSNYTAFSSAVSGVVKPSSNSNSSAFYLGGDNAFHSFASGFVYLGTVGTVSSQIVDTSTTSNILAANNATYRSFQLIFKNIIPNTTNVGLALQVHAAGSFQTSSYIAAAQTNTQVAETTGVFVVITGANIGVSDPGFGGSIITSNLASSSVKKHWTGHGGFINASTTAYAVQHFGGFYAGGNDAIDGFQIAPSAGGITSGNVDVYGML